MEVTRRVRELKMPLLKRKELRTFGWNCWPKSTLGYSEHPGVLSSSKPAERWTMTTSLPCFLKALAPLGCPQARKILVFQSWSISASWKMEDTSISLPNTSGDWRWSKNAHHLTNQNNAQLEGQTTQKSHTLAQFWSPKSVWGKITPEMKKLLPGLLFQKTSFGLIITKVWIETRHTNLLKPSWDTCKKSWCPLHLLLSDLEWLFFMWTASHPFVKTKVVANIFIKSPFRK